ncbi:MAG: hypothetical protein ABSE92_04345, partial [Terriglobales bacterium]
MSSTQIKVRVPYGTFPGNALVNQNGTWSQPAQYTFPAPTLTSVSASPGACSGNTCVPLMPGGTAYLRGSGFGSQQYAGSGAYLPRSNGIPIDYWSDSLIIGHVPIGTVGGNAYVQNSDQPSGYAFFQMANPQVFAFGAPFCWGGFPSGGCSQQGQNYFGSFLSNELPNISGIVVQVPWNQVDTGCTDGSPQHVARCTTVPTTCPESNLQTDFKFCNLDAGILDYVNNTTTSFNGKRIVFLIQPASDSGTNSFTPAYVITPGWATELSNTLHKTIQPQDQVVCGAYLGNVGSNTCPVENNSGQQIGLNDTLNFAVWNANYCTTSFRNTPAVDLTCNTASSCTNTRPYTNNTGFPIPYETPFMTAYQAFLTAFAQHYNPLAANPNGTNSGPTIAPYIAYVRPGMTIGSETTQLCAIQNGNGLTENQWAAGASIPAGYIVNTGTTGANGTQYVAIGAGVTGSSMPTCSSPGCTTGPDGSGSGAVPGWYNTGTWPQSGSVGVPVWPGPQGQFNSTGGNLQPDGYTDNGFLTTWNQTNDNSGYLAAMATFLNGLNASFPFDISARNGPSGGSPSFANVAYADASAAIASVNALGFGMESVSVEDQQTLNTPGTFPTTSQDWAHNFATYTGMVHHLQTFHPGNPYFAARYPINYIQVSTGGGSGNTPNTATIKCPAAPPINVDCGWYGNGPIYISGNAKFNSGNGNQIQIANPCNTTCATNTLTFYTSVAGGSTQYTGGYVWAPDYWPIILPLGTDNGATTFEVPECDLDYAYLQFMLIQNPVGGYYEPISPTANWVTSDPPNGQGCATWGVAGPDTNYSSAVTTALQY